MRGIILAGGHGTRLMPCTKVTNKHLLPVYDKPMILYPLETLMAAGIKDIMIVSGTGHAGHFLELLGSGRDYGIRISYAVQEKAGGIAEALGLCEDFADNDKIAVILGDNIYAEYDQIKNGVSDFAVQNRGAKIFLKEVVDPSRFGVAELNGSAVKKIEEKPSEPKSNLAVTGFYCYDSQVWEIIKTLKPSGRGELEITDVNNFYIDNSIMTYETLRGDWTDAGTFESLLAASNLIAKKVKNNLYGNN
ncbi:MAG: sugar phosphate nucleotidyltransferase [Candidatus Buchananbacteria bacterium]